MVPARADGAERRARVAMVGGGQHAISSAVHRMAMRLDDAFDLVAGALSSDPARAAASARDIGPDPSHSYASYEDMMRAEAARLDGAEAVAIVTPNHMHAPVAAACGWVNGAVISILRLQPIVATFATGVIIGGLALVVLPQAGGLPPAYYLTYGGPILGMPTPVIVFAGLVLFAVLIGRSRFRMHLTAVGGDVQAAFQTGLDVGAVRRRSHMLAGLALRCRGAVHPRPDRGGRSAHGTGLHARLGQRRRAGGARRWPAAGAG